MVLAPGTHLSMILMPFFCSGTSYTLVGSLEVPYNSILYIYIYSVEGQWLFKKWYSWITRCCILAVRIMPTRGPIPMVAPNRYLA